MVMPQELASYTNELLKTDSFNDYGPNGLQLEGRAEVRTLVSGVTASLAMLEAAAQANADVLLVHHGWFWKGDDPCITGMRRRRLQCAMDAGLSLLAYHLPLDAHPELGNNSQLARLLGFSQTGRFGNDHGMQLACAGMPAAPMSANEMSAHLERYLGRTPQHIAGSAQTIQRVGWCTGAAQSYIEAAVELDLDAFISGEISEQTVHIARECGIHYFAAGHHATERYGVQALGEHLAGHFNLDHQFIDIDNPV